MKSNKPAAPDAQASSDDPDEKKSAKQHTRDLFKWLDQVALDSSLRPSAFKAAYVIAEHVNRETGEAWPSSTTIAARCGLSQPTVVELVRSLEAAGHLEIEPGRAGRGHSHRYRLITKYRSADVSSPTKHRVADISRKAKTSRSPMENIGDAEIKHRRADMNLLKNHLMNNQEAGLRPARLVDRDNVTDQEDASENSRERAYGALWRVYPYHPDPDRDETDAREVFYQLLDEGVDPGEIISGATAYAKRCIGAHQMTIGFMVYWLRGRGWENSRN